MRERRLTLAALACLAAISCASLAVQAVHPFCHDGTHHEKPRHAHVGLDHSCPGCEFLHGFHAVHAPFLSSMRGDRVVSRPPRLERDMGPLRLGRRPLFSPRGPPPERGS